LYYRRDLRTKYSLAPPRTWEELVTQAERIRRGERDPRLDGVLWQGKQYEGLVVNVLEHLWANGTALLDERDRVLAEPAPAAAALALMRRLLAHRLSPSRGTAGGAAAGDAGAAARAVGGGPPRLPGPGPVGVGSLGAAGPRWGGAGGHRAAAGSRGRRRWRRGPRRFSPGLQPPLAPRRGSGGAG